MNRFLAILSVAGLLLGTGSPAAHSQSAATVNADRVNARSRPSPTGEVVTQLRRGQTVVLLDQGPAGAGVGKAIPGWTRIELPAGTPVWVSEVHLDPATATVRPRRLNVRAGPSEDYGVLGTVAQGTALRKLGGGDGWAQIEAPAGLSAYVAAKFLDPAAPLPAATGAPAPVPVPEGKPLLPAPAPTASGEVTSKKPLSPTPESPTEPPRQPRPAAPAARTDTQPGPAGVPVPAPATPPAAAASVPTAPTNPLPSLAEPADPGPVAPRIVQREGVVSGTLSIQAPTDFELRATDTGRRLNYLWPSSPDIDIRTFRGVRVRVTGEEHLEPRWPITPMIRVDRIILAP